MTPLLIFSYLIVGWGAFRAHGDYTVRYRWRLPNVPEFIGFCLLWPILFLCKLGRWIGDFR